MLQVSPNRTHFFEDESVSISCEVPGNVGGWILRKYTNHNGYMDLPLGKATFSITSLNISHSGAYWCQSESGEFSDLVNLNINSRFPLEIEENVNLTQPYSS